MKIIVFGSTGRVGRQIVDQALARGHTVTAFVHGTNPFKGTKVKVVQGDIYNPQDVERALDSAQAVISALGSWGTPKKDILSSAMKNIVPAMEKKKISRIISLTGAGANKPNEHWHLPRKLSHLMLATLAPKILKDGERHIETLQNSALAWTVIRSPIMTSDKKDNYKLNLKPNFSFSLIPHSVVVKAMLDCLEADDFIGEAPFIHKD